jgi:hypothetical protein
MKEWLGLQLISITTGLTQLPAQQEHTLESFSVPENLWMPRHLYVLGVIEKTVMTLWLDVKHRSAHSLQVKY